MSQPHVYVIHLKHRTDRKKQFLKAWSDAGFSTEHLHWHSAVLGSALSDTKLAAFRTVAKTRKARAGRVGCYCSHVAAIRKAIRLNHFPLLVLEDDAVPTKEVMPLNELFAAAPEATLLYFGAIPIKDRKRIKDYCQNKNGWFVPGDEQLYAAHSYGIATREAAQEFVAFIAANKMTLDSAFVRYKKLHRDRVAIHCPFQFIQSEGFSNIEGVMRLKR